MTTKNNTLATCIHQVEAVYLTPEKFLGVTIDGKIHWIAEQLDTIGDAVTILKRLNVDFIKKTHRWGCVERDGEVLERKSTTKVKIDDENLLDDKNGYIKHSKKAKNGSFWWSLADIEQRYFDTQTTAYLKSTPSHQ